MTFAARAVEASRGLIKVPSWANDVFEHYLICEFTTISDGKPVTFPLLYFYEPSTGLFTVTSSILFSRKIENIKDNSKVSLLFSNPTGSGVDKHAVLVQGVARIEEEDLDHGWERFLTDWREKETDIDSLPAERVKFGWVWKRIVVRVEPKKITVWKDGNTARTPEVFK